MPPVFGDMYAFAADRGSESSAEPLARRPSCAMNPLSLDRLARVARIAGIAALKPVVSADSESPVTTAARETIAGLMRSRMLSSIDAMVSLPFSLFLHHIQHECGHSRLLFWKSHPPRQR